MGTQNLSWFDKDCTQKIYIAEKKIFIIRSYVVILDKGNRYSEEYNLKTYIQFCE